MEATSHTFVFADLVGFTALADLEGDDRALEVVLAFQRRIQALLTAHGAEQIKVIGDGVMIRCSDAANAVMLALRLLDELEHEEGFPPVRVGMHTGPALCSDGDWYGRTVNVAARLCAVAPGGEVLVSEATRAAAGPIAGVAWGERELHWLRNVSEPVGTYFARVAGAAETAPAASARDVRRRADGSFGARAKPFSGRCLVAWMCPKMLVQALA